MSVVIVGGNECMSRQYVDLCKHTLSKTDETQTREVCSHSASLSALRNMMKEHCT